MKFQFNNVKFLNKLGIFYFQILPVTILKRLVIDISTFSNMYFFTNQILIQTKQSINQEISVSY